MIRKFLFCFVVLLLVFPIIVSATYDDFETGTMWVATGIGQGAFEIGEPSSFTSTEGECATTCLGTGPSSDHTSEGTKAACTNLNGYLSQYESESTNSLTSPIYNFNNKTNINLEFYRFMEIEGDNYDFCYYQYKNSQTGQWINFETYGGTRIDDNNWVKYTKDLSAFAAGKGYFQLRFYCTTDDWTEGSGLCLDDINITGGEGGKISICGNGVLEGNEKCDDGNLVNGDGCSSTCTIETLSVCGNNIKEGTEQCDDGNLINGDGCSSTCTIEGFYSIKICDWKNCNSGAASVSIDDGYSSCRDKLNANGFKGTYFLLNTQSFTSSDWNFWNTIYNEGHEIGVHTQNHPCSAVNEATLRDELSSNKNDIVSNLNIPEEEVVSFAWPCGYTNTQEKQIASEYFLSARGYHINQLEEENPGDFMNLKSLNTPYYHSPPLTPPDYFEMADLAEVQGKWVNFVFHNVCQEDGAINYLATKDLWVAPIGDVVKYIKERQNAEIQNFQVTTSSLKLDIVDSLENTLYNEKLTIEVFIENQEAMFVRINGAEVSFDTYINNGNYVRFDVLPLGNEHIEIIFSQAQNCNDADKDGYYLFSGECSIGNDCNDNNFNINPGRTDLCDGIDNDCNILVDEDFVQTLTTCGVGACQATGLIKCVAGIPVNSCVPGVPSLDDTTCNGIDDNCNGIVDEDCEFPSQISCQYANSAGATSESSGSLASYATGAPNAQYAGTCNQWSGYSYTWSPTNWNVKATLTLNYNIPVNANNFTIFGDYDMCWTRMWLKNSASGEEKLIFEGFDDACMSLKTLDGSFLADTIILETCGWGWSSTDAVQMCGMII